MTRRALISVSDKTGVLDFARGLQDLGWQVLSTGGTARLLTQGGLAVTEVGEYTGFPEMMEGRVKTLHPRIHGGILGRRGIDEGVMEAHGIAPIDLVAVNLYPFEQTVARPDCTLPEAIENIDIGGPTLLRAAAKNHRAVTVVVDPGDYALVIEVLTSLSDTKPLCESKLQPKAKILFCSGDYDLDVGTCSGELVSVDELRLFPNHRRRNRPAQFSLPG